MSTRIVVAVAFALSLLATVAPPEPARAAPGLSEKDIEMRVASLPADLRVEIAALRYRLTPDELADLMSDPRADRCRQWIDAYWKDRDPICTTPGNEAREEYERRVLVAQRVFPIPEWPGWDQRGEVFIRYGAPTGRQIVGQDVTLVGSVSAMEFWYYAPFNMMVRFEDAAGSRNYRYVAEDVSLPPSLRARNDRRVMPSEWLQDIYLDFMSIESSYYQEQNLGTFENTANWDKFQKMLFRFYEVMEKTPAAFSFEFDRSRVPMQCQALSFRGGPSVDRIDVNAEFRANIAQPPDTAATRTYTTTAVLWDTSWKEVGRRVETTTLPTVSGFADTSCTIVSQLVFALPPDFYHLGVTVKDEATGRFTSTQRDLACWDFERPLAMSDLCLARRIAPVTQTSPFNRGALEVVPHPTGHYAPGSGVPLYFEVYHLTPGSDGLYHYTVEYSLTPLTPRPKGFWKSLVSGKHEDPTTVVSRFNFTAHGSTDVVHVLVNSQNLWAGDYRLDVSVEDAISSRRATRQTTFTLTGKELAHR